MPDFYSLIAATSTVVVTSVFSAPVFPASGHGRIILPRRGNHSRAVTDSLLSLSCLADISQCLSGILSRLSRRFSRTLASAGRAVVAATVIAVATAAVIAAATATVVTTAAAAEE